MDKVAKLSTQERKELFGEAAAKKGVTPAIIEKDFWVTWVLSKLFSNVELSRILMFKGGTSLSKVFKQIERFSEDIDLILDWRLVTSEDPLHERSKTQQKTLNASINEQAKTYICTHLFPLISSQVSPICTCTISEDTDKEAVLNIDYPAAFSNDYFRAGIQLEIGPLAAWLPSSTFNITSYAAEAFPHVFEHPSCTVNSIHAERTFWDKATILHQEAHRPPHSPLPSRYSRHYFDLAQMAGSQIKVSALADLDLLASVVSYKELFYPRGWARYDLAQSGTFKLAPAPHILTSLEDDYTKMREMIFGGYLPFKDMLAHLATLEQEINAIHPVN